jgi:hypothetical protein
MKMKNKNIKKIFIIGVIIILLTSSLVLFSNNNNSNNINIDPFIAPDTSNAYTNLTFIGLPDNYLVIGIYANSTILDLLPVSDGYNLQGNSIFAQESINNNGSINVPVSMYIGNTSYINNFGGKLSMQYEEFPYLLPLNVTSITPRTLLVTSPNILTNGYMQIMFFNVSEYSNICNYIDNAKFTNPNQFLKGLSEYAEIGLSTPNQSVTTIINNNFEFFVNNKIPQIFSITITKIPANYTILYAYNFINYKLSNGIFKGTVYQYEYSNVTFSSKNYTKTFYFDNINNNVTTNWNSTNYLIPVNYNSIFNRTDVSYLFIAIMFIILLITLKYTNYVVTDITGFILFFIGFSLKFAYFNLISLTVMIFLVSLYTTLKLIGGNK